MGSCKRERGKKTESCGYSTGAARATPQDRTGKVNDWRLATTYGFGGAAEEGPNARPQETSDAGTEADDGVAAGLVALITD